MSTAAASSRPCSVASVHEPVRACFPRAILPYLAHMTDHCTDTRGDAGTAQAGRQQQNHAQPSPAQPSQLSPTGNRNCHHARQHSAGSCGGNQQHLTPTHTTPSSCRGSAHTGAAITQLPGEGRLEVAARAALIAG
jgi:hypothetical protein